MSKQTIDNRITPPHLEGYNNLKAKEWAEYLANNPEPLTGTYPPQAWFALGYYAAENKFVFNQLKQVFKKLKRFVKRLF